MNENRDSFIHMIIFNSIDILTKNTMKFFLNTNVERTFLISIWTLIKTLM